MFLDGLDPLSGDVDGGLEDPHVGCNANVVEMHEYETGTFLQLMDAEIVEASRRLHDLLSLLIKTLNDWSIG